VLQEKQDQRDIMNLSDITNLLNYTEWANELAMEAAAKLPDDGLHRDFGISHKSIFGTLAHMAGAEWIWLERWHGRSPGKEDAWSRWTPESCGNLLTLKDRWGDVIDRRTRYVSALDQDKLDAAMRARCDSSIRCNTSSITPRCIADKSSA
jgi:uncharacterized damage-inducible protein DinB